ncbi:MAG: DUF4878 domain-containing protein [Bacteroidia bacterium]|nr:DUF4878 domain-containing protein [Bacteroidia bacterium]MDW8345375.1 DUF4878 domain-containing protein [Bacteroidia bacterium]
MKKSIISLFIILILAALGCKKNNPSYTVLAFLEAVDNQDFTKAKKYCTQETQKLMVIMEGMMKIVPKEQLQKVKRKENYIILREEIAGDRALVVYKNSDSNKEEQIKLKKENGKWLISMDKADLGDKKNPFEENKKEGIDN